MNIILLYFAIKYEGNWDLIYKALDQKEKVSLKEITDTEEKAKAWTKAGYDFKTLLDIDYPKQFKEAYKPPFVFWYKGNISIIKDNTLALSVESLSPADESLVDETLKSIKNSHKVLINPELTPADDQLSEKAKVLNIKQVHICNAGVEKIVPDKNTLYISEYLGTASSKLLPNSTNRLAASLANELVLISSSQENHANLVTNFLNLGKEVNCFPKDAASKDFNNELIKQGANLITDIKQLDKDLERGLDREQGH